MLSGPFPAGSMHQFVGSHGPSTTRPTCTLDAEQTPSGWRTKLLSYPGHPCAPSDKCPRDHKEQPGDHGILRACMEQKLPGAAPAPQYSALSTSTH